MCAYHPCSPFQIADFIAWRVKLPDGFEAAQIRSNSGHDGWLADGPLRGFRASGCDDQSASENDEGDATPAKKDDR
jgi:hypothetical protein